MTVRRQWPAWRLIVLALALWAGWNASYISLKAELAQSLLERAWQQSSHGTSAIKPWSWADTWPVAKLSFPRLGVRQLVLGGASGRNLAFGPAHWQRSGWPGDGTATLIAGHRDTHFAHLADLTLGDYVELERGGRQWRYRVDELTTVHRDAGGSLGQLDDDSLLLVTCWPFGAVNPNTPWRYVVRAVPVDGSPRLLTTTAL